MISREAYGIAGSGLLLTLSARFILRSRLASIRRESDTQRR